MSTRLPYTFDVARLEADLATCDAYSWQAHNNVGWSCLALRSASGVVEDATQGPLGWERWLSTPLLDRCQYFREVLAALDSTYRLAAVRVSSLAPGGRILVHVDDTTPQRIHVPITTNAESMLRLGSIEHNWQPGEAWLGDFGQPHTAWNYGTTRRVHLLAVVR